jgi:hypothetical protein
VFRRRGVEMGRLGEGERRRTALELSEWVSFTLCFWWCLDFMDRCFTPCHACSLVMLRILAICLECECADLLILQAGLLLLFRGC